MTVMIPATTVIPVLTTMAIFRVRAFTASPYYLPAWPARWSVAPRADAVDDRAVMARYSSTRAIPLRQGLTERAWLRRSEDEAQHHEAVQDHQGAERYSDPAAHPRRPPPWVLTRDAFGIANRTGA